MHNNFDDFDRDFKTVKRLGIAGAAVSVLIMLAVLGFAGWAVIAILQHFGIV